MNIPDRFPALIILGISLALRGLFPSWNHVEHFDEGVYASNRFFDQQSDFAYPNRHLYAPPLFPALVEWSQILLGIESQEGFVVNLLYGVATVMLVWWVAHEWFGPVAGVVTAFLAATSDFHVLYSRTILTDVGMGFWFLMGLYLYEKAIISERRSLLIATAFAVSLAWASKYNGWLALAVMVSATIPWLLTERSTAEKQSNSSEENSLFTPSLKNTLPGLLIVCLASLAFWWPVLQGLEHHGGYPVVSENHARYFNGFPLWTTNLLEQFKSHRVLTGMISLVGLLLAMMISLLLFFRSRGTLQTKRIQRVLLGTISLCCLLVGITAKWGMLAVLLPISLSISLAWMVWRVSVGLEFHWTADGESNSKWKWMRQGNSHPQSRLGLWLLSAWVWGLTLGTPLYHPYPRISLPWLMACWMGMGLTIQWACDLASHFLHGQVALSSSDRTSDSHRKGLLFSSVCLGAILLGLVLFTTVANEIPLRCQLILQDRSELKTISNQIVHDINEAISPEKRNPIPWLLYTCDNPALFFHLRNKYEGVIPSAFASEQLRSISLESKKHSRPTFLVFGLHTEEEVVASREWPKKANIELFRKYEYDPSLLVRLNLREPGDLNPYQRTKHHVLVFR